MSSANKKYMWLAIIAILVYLYSQTSPYRKMAMGTTGTKKMAMGTKKSAYDNGMDMMPPAPMDMMPPAPMGMSPAPMGMSSAYVRAAQKYDEYGVPLSNYDMSNEMMSGYKKKKMSYYGMDDNTMTGSNYLDGSSITTPISSTGDGTRKNQLYDIRPQPDIGTGDPLKDYMTTSNPIRNNGLY